MKDFRPLDRRARQDWPRFVCSAIEGRCGHVCDLTATLMQPMANGSPIVRTYCDRHAPPGAVPIPLHAHYQVSRIELRVAVPSLEGDPYLAAEDVARRLANHLEDVGALVVGLRVVGQKADQGAPEGPPLRLELAGRGEPAARGDRPFWGNLTARTWRPWRRREKTG